MGKFSTLEERDAVKVELDRLEQANYKVYGFFKVYLQFITVSRIAVINGNVTFCL